MQHAGELTEAVGSIYMSQKPWHLMSERTGDAADSTYRAALRVIILMLIGALLGLSLGIVFDNRFLAGSFISGGALAGLLAGLVLEAGFPSGHPAYIRAAADLLLAAVLSVSTLLIPVAEGTAGAGLRSRPNAGYGRAQAPARLRKAVAPNANGSAGDSVNRGQRDGRGIGRCSGKRRKSGTGFVRPPRGWRTGNAWSPGSGRPTFNMYTFTASAAGRKRAPKPLTSAA
ncbi:hypothetical protein LJK88_20160 [Paenibacillus sp. P26]|nr:hypothetical protein LJK88_20160 [Paenibacillus sp. P26]